MASKGDIHLEEASGQEARPQPEAGVVATLDTSGHFHVMPGHPLHRFMGVNRLEWSDLSPFAQGYVEALLSPADDRTRTYQVGCVEVHRRPAAFSDLAPETLARIMEDCERYQRRFLRDYEATTERAASFWRWRNNQPAGEISADFPPLTPYLGDDGKVCLRGAAQ